MDQDRMETCIVCGQPKEEGIHIVNEFICISCEMEMVQTKVEDEKYPFFVNRLRRIAVRYHV
ncbi:hypothetical protein J2Z47_005961 [Cohnella thailandensis]|jgi:Inhibitor of sigma-G Gin.|uniref:Sigma factor G inhibitor Gin n=2 Tax=Cohnella thailandensis TaxID=557557 RepID=A0A841T5X1_9BACL|nr:sigma factor G inhibitor Gin [Cohnella thailandensis]MBB6638256.1 sigma factor G inhibitor Gin [Cohnella thailandensis]MBP1977678.1 hypothetical protein [Cohnella thailandensis]